jgi:hypothetical protein
MGMYAKFPARWLRKGLLAITAVLVLMLVSACGGGNTVHVYDNAGVLDQNKVQNEASNLSKPIDIYTVNTFTGSKTDFDRATLAKLGNNPDLIVVAIDTVHHHLAIVRGANVPLSTSQIQGAVNAFASNYGNSDYTGATIAAVGSMRNSMGTQVGPSGGGAFAGMFGTLCVIGLVILGLILLFGIFARRRLGGGSRPPMYQQPPYNQGYPPNYYGPGNQGPGMNPWAAGGLGAAAGGFLGYELGKQTGEREAHEQGQGDGGWAGASGDFGGGGAGGDFGGGGGGGGDFGGGGGGDFGGGGGGDFGGGGSGDF